MTALSNADCAQHIHKVLNGFGAVPLDDDLPEETTVGRLRRRRAGGVDDVCLLTLVDVDDVLVWESGPLMTAPRPGLRRGFRGVTADGDIVTQVKFKPLGKNEVIDQLHKFDTSLTPRADRPNGVQLLQYDTATWVPTAIDEPAADGHILLIVHGTFSNSENMVNELRADTAFMSKLADSYTQVLGFDHFTVSQTPVVNAAALARYFARSKAKIDIICHSRGGLVTRWFVERFDQQVERKVRVVFVGCPLQGTSLADPKSLRNGLNLLTNVGKVLGQGAALIPFLQAASGLMQIVTSIGAVAANSPLVDLGLGLLPGISAMSRIDRNAELNATYTGLPLAREGYFGVASSFRSEDAGWKFWKRFNTLAVADKAADYLVFNQPNDLVVDTSSMTHDAFGTSPDQSDASKFLVFGEEKLVHHTAYFSRLETRAFIDRVFTLDALIKARHAPAGAIAVPSSTLPGPTARRRAPGAPEKPGGPANRRPGRPPR